MENGKEILYYDVTSECPFVNSQKEYPVDYPNIFLKHQLPQTNKERQRREFFGIALCSIVPPAGSYIYCCRFVIRERSCFPSVASVAQKSVKMAVHGPPLTIEVGGIQTDHFKKRSDSWFSDFIVTKPSANLRRELE